MVSFVRPKDTMGMFQEENRCRIDLEGCSKIIIEREKLLSLADSLGTDIEGVSLEDLRKNVRLDLLERVRNTCSMQSQSLGVALDEGDWKEEIEELQGKMQQLSSRIQESVSLEGLLQIEKEAYEVYEHLSDLKRLRMDLEWTQREKEEEIESFTALCDRLREAVSSPLEELGKKLEEVSDLLNLKGVRRLDAVRALNRFKGKIGDLKKEIHNEALRLAKKLPLPERRNVQLMTVAFGKEAAKLQQFAEENFAKLIAESVVSGRSEKIKLVEGGKKIAVLRTFREKGEVHVMVLVPLGKGDFKA